MQQLKSSIDIVIADDNPDHIQIATSILSQLNCQIRIATNGASAYKLITQKKPTLALLDVSMPQMNGFELCKKIKSNPNLCDIAIIFMTASNDEHSINEGFKCGAQDYVLKPYNQSEFLSRIQTHLSLRLKTMELETAYEELDRFCHTISHDLKAPVMILKQLTNLLALELGTNMSGEVSDILSRINQKSSDVTVMIQRLLELSRMKQKNLKYEQIHLNDLIDELISELIPLEKDRNVHFHIAPLPILTGDITMIYFLFQNLFTNALKFTRPKENAEINITYEASSLVHKIYVMDNGVGFDKQYAHKLFNVFERLHSQKDFEGAGVGLSIAKKIMDRHQGSITIDSVEHEGTTVTLEFPRNNS